MSKKSSMGSLRPFLAAIVSIFTSLLVVSLSSTNALAQANLELLEGLGGDFHAAKVCTPARVAGTYAFQFAATFGPDPQNPAVANVPFAELGTFVVDKNGNMKGASNASYGGFIYHQTFFGTVTYNEDCTARVSGTNETLGRPFKLLWVIVDPGKEMMLFSLEPGTVGPGRAVRMPVRKCCLEDQLDDQSP